MTVSKDEVRADAALFRAAMARFASGVVVSVALDAEGKPRGFTASAFCSVSLDPPLVLVCLDKRADSHATFMTARRMTISLLAPGQDAVALRFATRGADKFAGDAMMTSPGGLPAVRDAAAVLDCRLAERVPAGDHTILIAAVEQVTLKGAPQTQGPGMVHYARRFWSVGKEQE